MQQLVRQPAHPLRLPGHLAVLLAYTALALLASWPLAARLTTHLPALTNESGKDIWQNVWNIWWVQQAVLVQHTNPYTTDALFSPHGASLALHTLNLPLGLLGLPLLPLTGVVPAYNLLTLLVLVLAGYGAFLLARHVTGSNPAALVAGALVLCSPQRLNELRLAQLPTLSDYAVPLALLALLLALERRTWRAAALVAALVLVAALSSWYHLFHLLLLSAMLLLWHLITAAPGTRRAALLPWLRVALLSGLVLLPFVLPLAAQALATPAARKADELVISADLLRLVPLWPTFVWQPVPPDWLGSASLSWLPLLLAGLGLVLLPRRTLPWAAMALVCALLALGPSLLLAGRDTGVPLPYGLLRALPVLDVLRAPMRINALTTLLLALVAAIGLARLLRPLRPPLAWSVAGLLALLALAEGARLPLTLRPAAVSPFYAQLAAQPVPSGERSTVLEYPLNRLDHALQAMYAQAHHGQRIPTGLLSREVPRFPYEGLPLFANIEFARVRPDIVGLSPPKQQQLLQAMRLRWLVFHEDSRVPGRAARQAATAERLLPGLTMVYSDTALRAYWLDTPPGPAEVPLLLALAEGWQPAERGERGYGRWLPARGGAVWAYSSRPQRVVLAVTTYSIPGARPLEIWRAGAPIQTIAVPAGLDPRIYYSAPFDLPAGPTLLELRAPQGGASPRALGLGDDERSLSFSIQQLELLPVQPVP